MLVVIHMLHSTSQHVGHFRVSQFRLAPECSKTPLLGKSNPNEAFMSWILFQWDERRIVGNIRHLNTLFGTTKLFQNMLNTLAHMCVSCQWNINLAKSSSIINPIITNIIQQNHGRKLSHCGLLHMSIRCIFNMLTTIDYS